MQQINTKENQYFKQLDGFRFISIIAVMISHFIPIEFVNRLPLGYGVMFFFVLSSFLITRILLSTKKTNELNTQSHFFSLKQFYARRFLRIFPIYYLLIIFLYIINWIPVRDVMFYLVTYTMNFKIGSGFDAGNFNHLWSLAVEEQFYIFFPFIVFFVNSKKLLSVFIFMTAFGLIGRCLLYLYDQSNVPFSNFHTISCLDSLGIGSILAYLSLYESAFLAKVIGNRFFFNCAILLFLIVMIISFSSLASENRVNVLSMVGLRFLFNLMSFWVLGWAIVFGYKGSVGSMLEFRPIVYLGRISYGIYLYHLFVPQFVGIVFNHFKIQLSFENDSLVLALIYILVTIFIASMSWFLIEKPLNMFKKYFDYNKKNKTLSQFY